MSLVLAIHSINNIYEYFLPGINNRKIGVEIPASATGYASDISLDLEVWNGVWQINESDGFAVFKDKEKKESVLLQMGLALTCENKRSGERIYIVVEGMYEGYSGFDKYYFKQGKYGVGRDEGNEIRYNSRNLVTGRHAVLTRGPNNVCNITDNSSNGTFVNGKKISGTQKLNFGDVIYIIGLKIVYLGEIIAINNPAEPAKISGLTAYEPPAGKILNNELRTDEYYQRSPRHVESLDEEIIEIEKPPSPAKTRRQPIAFTLGPTVSMVIPMAAGALFAMQSVRQTGGISSPFMFMGIITSVTAAFIGAFWAVLNHGHQKKSELEEEERRSEAYRAYLDKIKKLLVLKNDGNRNILTRKYPGANECLNFVKTKSRRLWERNANHLDFLTVRIGRGDIQAPNKIIIPKEGFSLIDDTLADEPANIKAEFDKLREAPVCVSLLTHTLIGIIGDKQETCNTAAKLIAAQIAAYHAYTDVRTAFIYNVKESADFEFAKWLPHSWSADGGLRMLACDANGVGELLYFFSELIRERMGEPGYSADKNRPLPHYVIFISEPSLVENEAVAKYLYSPENQMGITVILLYGQIDRLPNGCTVIIQNDGDYKGFYSLDNGFEGYRDVAFDSINVNMLNDFSRGLSGVRVRETHAAGAAPQLLTFLDMYKTSDAGAIDIERRWLANRTYESMKAVIGFRGADTPLYLDIHEKYHGPHGLVAGTTGSGKSETLQTYILSLALNYHPYEISFILIDYKGGGMAGSFEKLPHIAGIITNLGGNQTNRALASINSEIKRRQEIFNNYKIKHIDGYIELFRANKADLPVPHLIIIADEFAELKKEQPEFVRELISASRVGRSLGVHLILATQKPSGVVDDEIWGNSKFRLCMRVQDKQDSNEMIKRPDAAYITNVGRGYFQVGNDEIFEIFQSGWSGAAYEPEIPYSDTKRGEAGMINLWGKPSVVGSGKKITVQTGGEKRQTQLEAVALHISVHAEKLGIKPIDNIWLPPLPKKISLPQIKSFAQKSYRNGVWKGTHGEFNPIIGIADDPINQRQEAVSIDILSEGHLLIVGAASGGKTTFLQTLLFSLVSTYSPKQFNFYVVDFGSRTLGVFNALPHCGGVVYDNEIDKADKLAAFLLKELNRRKIAFSEKGIGSVRDYLQHYDDVPLIIFAIDNYAAWNENCPKTEDGLICLNRIGVRPLRSMLFVASRESHMILAVSVERSV